ncbi:hypothetical protein BJP40_15610 [Streptomyces sp. CC53]|nr:hypothetical protein BJP40_15610 [Streptomyces sp. CC53]
MLSPSAPMTSVGVRSSGQVLSRFQGVSGTAAWSDGRLFAASRLPPPPIECPITPRRLLSTRPRRGLTRVRWSSAATSWRPRLSGWSNRVSVSMVNTTNPCEARRGPSQAIVDSVPV